MRLLKRPAGGLTALLAMSVPVAAGAQDTIKPVDIVVTARPATRAAAHARAQAFVRATGIAQGAVPAARFVRPMCPRVYGIAPAYAARVEYVMRATALAVPVPVRRVGCEPNVAVIFAEDARAMVATLARHRDSGLWSQPVAVERLLREGTMPVRWWGNDDALDVGGSGAGTAITAATVAGGNGAPVGNAPVNARFSSSLIDTGETRNLGQSIVVIDLPRATGVPLDAVAIYAAVVAMANVAPSAMTNPPRDSILAMFDGGPRGLTDLDRAMLHALYRLQLERTAMQQRGKLTQALTKAAFAEASLKD